MSVQSSSRYPLSRVKLGRSGVPLGAAVLTATRAGYSAVLMRIVVDVSPLSRPRTGIGNYLRGMLAAVRSCDVVFASSRFTGGEAVELLGVPEERVVVAYPGVDPLFRPEGERADLGGPYVLSVSTLEPRKNLPALVAAFALLRRR